MDNNSSTAALVDGLIAPMGDQAPKKRWVVIDFKGTHGEDRNLSTYLYHDRLITDEMIVQAIANQIASEGGKLCSLCEIIEDEDGQRGRCIYSAPGYLEETMRERGLPIPEDMVTNANAAGFRPINWDELVQGWEAGA